jgi:hypothetical protein
MHCYKCYGAIESEPIFSSTDPSPPALPRLTSCIEVVVVEVVEVEEESEFLSP